LITDTNLTSSILLELDQVMISKRIQKK